MEVGVVVVMTTVRVVGGWKAMIHQMQTPYRTTRLHAETGEGLDMLIR